MAVYTYSRRLLPLRNRFLITDQAGIPVFSVVRDLPVWSHHFAITDTRGVVVAETWRRSPPFPPIVEVSAGGQLIVTVRRLFGLPPRFALPELDWEAQAAMGMRQVTIVDGSGLTQASISRRFTDMRLVWTLETSGSIPDVQVLAIALAIGSMHGRRRR